MSTRYFGIDELVIDKEFEELLPVLSSEEFEKLEKSILKHGLLDPIKIWQDPDTDKWIIIDGHNRYKIIKKNNIKWNAWCDYKILYEKDLETRDDVKRWMLEQQLGRRNLSDAEKYEIVQKFKGLFTKQAKENQSSGGKGLTNLSKVNTRKEMAKATGVSEGTYQKLDVVMQSDNEDVKQQLREKKISVDKAYREIKNPVSQNQGEIVTPQQQIEKLDNRMNEIDKEISSLRTERESLMRRRSGLFEALDIPCELKYEFLEREYQYLNIRKCRFYIEIDGHKEIFIKCSVLSDEPDNWMLNKIPDKYKNDFIMLWKKARKEEIEYSEELDREFERKLVSDDNKCKDFYKQCYRVLAKIVHPDNADGNVEAMQCLNQLKTMWGV